ncbi:MAG: hypothetical protein GY796_16165 [Chloroflexi bacterium]|nr:hypothetical protein [Chloroflexota bacterium]
MSLSAHQLVTSRHEWEACLQRLRAELRLALDLEANSMYAYRERVCLVQISIPGQDYIVDPVANLDLSGLGEIIENTAVEKIFHAAEYDLILLKREYGWQCHNLFDTMWAARILGYNRYGLANLLEQFFDVQQNKKFQKSNWCRRPLSRQQRHYAQMDTHYLFALRERLDAELAQAGRLEESREIFAQQTWVTPANIGFDSNGFWSIKGANDLTRQKQAILKALYAYRDNEAQRRDQPLFKVFGDKTLLDLAQTAPQNQYEMQKVYGMSNGQIRRYGRQLLQTIAAGAKAAPPPYPKRNKRPPDAVCNRYEQLHTWRKKTAQARGVESDVIISRDALWAIARKNPRSTAQLTQIEEIGDWRRQTYGDEIIQLLKR